MVRRLLLDPTLNAVIPQLLDKLRVCCCCWCNCDVLLLLEMLTVLVESGVVPLNVVLLTEEFKTGTAKEGIWCKFVFSG